MYGYLIRWSWFLQHHWYEVLMDRKSLREVKFLTGYTSGFPLHDAPFLVLKGPYSVTINFRFVCTCMYASWFIRFWFFWGGGGQFASHETFFWIATDTDYGLNTLHGVYMKHSVQPLSDFCKDYVSRSFTQVKFYVSRNFYKFKSNFFISSTRKIWKVYFEMYNKKIKTSGSTKQNVM